MTHPDEALFNRFKQLEYRFSNLKAVVQNDYDRMIADGYITSHAEVDKQKLQFLRFITQHKEELNKLQKDTLDRLAAVSNSLKLQDFTKRNVDRRENRDRA